MNNKRASGVFIGRKVIQEGATKNIIAKETFGSATRFVMKSYDMLKVA